MTKKITSVDNSTELWVVNKEKQEAEPLDGFFVYHANRPKFGKDKDFLFMFQSNALTKLALNENLQGNDFRLLLVLFEYLDFENLISITQQQLADILKTKKQNISVSLGRLVAQGILDKQKHGNRNIYKLNSSYAWKGKAAAYNDIEKRKKEMERKTAKVVQIKDHQAQQGVRQI